MCGVMLVIIILVLALSKFPVTLNSSARVPSYTNFTVSYCSSYCSSSSFCYCSVASSSVSFSTMSFNLSHPYPILSIILLYNKETVSPRPWSLSASTSRVAATGTDTAFYSLEIVFYIQLVMFIIYRLLENFEEFYGQKISKENFPRSLLLFCLCLQFL